ncbi:MAG: type VI secretion system-associated protein TagF [bacterium]
MIPPTHTLELAGFGCFGKLPISREYIVEGSRWLSESGFDQWIGEGVGLAKARLDQHFHQRITGFPHYRFFWDGGQDNQLAGVMCPSEDAAGRKSPFALFACLRGSRISAISTALQVWSLQEQAATLLESVSTAESPVTLRESIRSADQNPPFNNQDFQAEYQRFLAEQSGGSFWRNVGATTDDGGRFTVLQALVETLEPLRRNKNRAFRGGIQYPLSRGNSTDTALESCFWLDLTENCLGHPLASSWWFRSPGEPQADSRHLFLFLSPPTGNQWISLIDPDMDLESISYLDRPYGVEPPEQRMDPNLRAILESETSNLGEYLRWASES